MRHINMPSQSSSRRQLTPFNSPGIGLMMATALENNGATVYIIGRRLEVLQNAAAQNNV